MIAATQRGYFSGSSDNPRQIPANTVVTIVAGRLNCIGISPKIKCDVPQPINQRPYRHHGAAYRETGLPGR